MNEFQSVDSNSATIDSSDTPFDAAARPAFPVNVSFLGTWPGAASLIACVLGVLGALWLVIGAIERNTTQLAATAVNAGYTDAKAAAASVVKVVRRGLDAAFQPGVNRQAVFAAKMGEMSTGDKFIVLTQEVDVVIYEQEPGKILWDQIDLGTTQTILVAPRCKFQYFLPISQNIDKYLDLDEDNRVLRIRLPRPVLDAEMLVIPSSPSATKAWTNVPFFRLSSSGKTTEGKAREQLQPYLEEFAKHKNFRTLAELSAKDAFHRIVRALRPCFADDILIDLDFERPIEQPIAGPPTPGTSTPGPVIVKGP